MSNWPVPNSVGVYVSAQCEHVTYLSRTHTCASVTINVVQVAENVWKMAYSVRMPSGGCGFLPSVDEPSFASRDEAVFEAARKIKKYVEGGQYHTATDRHEASKIARWCDSFKQLVLL